MSASEVLPIRRAVLRDGRADLPADFPEDDGPDTLHLAALAGFGDAETAYAVSASPKPGERERIVGVATFFPSPYEAEPDAAWQLRGMAVLPEVQGTGVGGALLAEGARRIKAAGGALIWAKGRDSALGFYERQGWKVVGESFVYGAMGLPHHVVLLPL